MPFDDELNRFKSTPEYQKNYGKWKGLTSTQRIGIVIGVVVVVMIAVAVLS